MQIVPGITVGCLKFLRFNWLVVSGLFNDFRIFMVLRHMKNEKELSGQSGRFALTAENRYLCPLHTYLGLK
jgi:hypothetical protein